MEATKIICAEESFWDVIEGKNLVKANGSVHKANLVLANKKIVLLYFSANWCQDCIDFTPTLRSFYEVISVKKPGVKVMIGLRFTQF